MNNEDAREAFDAQLPQQCGKISALGVRLFGACALGTLVASCSCVAAFVWGRYYRMNIISIEPNREDNGPEYTLCYFPVLDGPDGLKPATSYAHSLGGIGYNRLRTDYNRCRSLPVQWCFRREREATKYGFVVRRWYPPLPPRRRGGRLDGTDLRVFWVTADEIEAAIASGRLDIPRFNDLSRFDRAIAARMVQVGEDLVP